jgi:TolB-like protein/Tfp pilus assembly protein PilF
MAAIMPDQTRPAGAVFLSYAREDGDAARRIAEALRGFGIEVWFDLSELRGGDAWDAKIKKQIRECTLFVPIISAQTQVRREGYFRREWNLAVERTLDMSATIAFIVPVIVDDTRESAADVPEQFLKAHCTRLAGGIPTPQFVEQVTRLLSGPSLPDPGARPAPRAPLSPPTVPARSGFPILTVALGAAVIALAAFVFLRPAAKPESATAPAAPPAVTGKVPEPAVASTNPAEAKSIAVLPFVDMSQTKDQEYFSDGLSEELLNLLAKIPALQVTSRSSAFSYKGKDLKLAQVARELNVAHILEGSVRKSGNRLRITAQLIDARTDKHLWSETYDRTLEDIFAVQDEIAAAVVGQLKITLLGSAPKAKVADPKAYALFLQARQLAYQNTDEGLKQAVSLYQQALGIDPTLGAAWIGLADCYLLQTSSGSRSNDEAFRLVREAVNKALAIDPDLASAHAMLGIIATTNDGETAAAARHFEHALALDPTNTDIMVKVMNFLRSLGRLNQSVALGEYITAHDPVNSFGHARLGGAYIRAGRFDEGIAAMRTALRLSPGRGQTYYGIGMALLQKGDARAALAEMQQEPSESWRQDGLAMIYHALGQKAQSDAALEQLIKKYEKDASWNIAYVLAFRGEADRAFEWLDKAVAYRDSGLSDTAVMWAFTNIRKDPRWLPFLRKIGRAPEQLEEIKFDVKLPAR